MNPKPDVNTKILEVKGLKKYFPIRKGFFKKTVGQVKSVDGLNFFIEKGETLGLVGESGCGKSSAIKLILRSYDVLNGSLNIDGKNIKDLNLH